MKKAKVLEFSLISKINWKIVVGKGAIESLGDFLDLKGYSKIGIVADKIAWKLFGLKVKKVFEKNFVKPSIFLVEPGEKSKSLREAEKIYSFLLKENFDRKSLLFAFGGGVVGDLTGFVAGTYMRGIDFVQLPTTLLAQVDAAIGGKTGVNFLTIKNIIGVFHHPKAIISDISFLSTLPERQLKSGLAEVVKYGAIEDPEILKILEKKGAGLSEEDLEMLVLKSSKIKGKIVELDAKEKKGLRAALNFGHTLGHAIEAEGKGLYTHGEAISVGMVFAAWLSYSLGFLKKDKVERLISVLEKIGLPTKAKVKKENLFEKMIHDKKSFKGRPRWVLLQDFGKVIVNQEVEDDIIFKNLERVLE